MSGGAARRLLGVLDDHVVAPLTGRPSPSRYWYLPQPARIVDASSRDAYLGARQPPYVIDYRARLAWPLVGADGIMLIPYGPPIGDRINPEAAFQFALGAHDAALDGAPGAHDLFLNYAAFFLARQQASGAWDYDFDWHHSAAPWGSALAQSRGASVMLRAARLTGEDAYAAAALKALAGFDVPLAEGGYLATHGGAGVPYFEEYPKEPVAVVNGFMAAIFGVFEVGRFLGDARMERLGREATRALVRMLPFYEHGRWTLYDNDPSRGGKNVHSPFYHRLCVDYLRVLATLSGDAALAEAARRWASWDTAPNRAAAAVLKLIRKVRVR